jgi:hypothetical protein
LLAVRSAGDEASQAVYDQEHRVRQLGSRATRPGSQLDEKVLESVGEPAHTHHADHAGGPLHRVGLTEYPVNRGLVVWRRLEREQA